MVFYNSFLIAILSFLFTNVICPSAKVIYSAPDFSKTSNKFEIYTIDFMGTNTPKTTYWALFQFSLDLSDLKKKYTDVTGGVVYGGLQVVENGRKSIMACWQVEYKDKGVKKIIKSNRVYPKGSESTFDNEGSGTNFLTEYNWPTNVWNRFVVRTWKDELTGNTFIGGWIQNLKTGQWTLHAYFNTNLQNSFILGEIHLFQEHYTYNYFGLERSFRIKNMYVFDKVDNKWISLNTTRLYIDDHNDTAGTHELGSTKDYFYASSGLPVDDQKSYDKTHPSSFTGTITQPETPSFSKPVFKSINVSLTQTKITITWSIDPTSTPCYKYLIEVFKDNNGGWGLIHSNISTRPEQQSYTYTAVFKGTYLAYLTCYSISNNIGVKYLNKTI